MDIQQTLGVSAGAGQYGTEAGDPPPTIRRYYCNFPISTQHYVLVFVEPAAKYYDYKSFEHGGAVVLSPPLGQEAFWHDNLTGTTITVLKGPRTIVVNATCPPCGRPQTRALAERVVARTP